MTRRNDPSMLLILSQEETHTVRNIIKPVVEPPPQRPIAKWLLGALGVTLLIALAVLGMVKPDLAAVISQLAERVLTLLL